MFLTTRVTVCLCYAGSKRYLRGAKRPGGKLTKGRNVHTSSQDDNDTVTYKNTTQTFNDLQSIRPTANSPQ